jgi:hypothetical protein
MCKLACIGHRTYRTSNERYDYIFLDTTKGTKEALGARHRRPGLPRLCRHPWSRRPGWSGGTPAAGKKGHVPAPKPGGAPVLGKPGHAPAPMPGGAPAAASSAPKGPVSGPPYHVNGDDAPVASSWGA